MEGIKEGYKRLRLCDWKRQASGSRGIVLLVLSCGMVCAVTSHGALIKNLRVTVLDMHPGQEHGLR